MDYIWRWAALTVIFCLGVTSAGRVSAPPRNVTVGNGEDAVLQCAVDAATLRDDVIEWYLRDTWRGGVFQWVTIYDSLSGQIHEERDQFWRQDFSVDRYNNLHVSKNFIANYLRKPADLAPQFACKLLSEGVFHMASIKVQAPRISQASAPDVYFPRDKDAMIQCEVSDVTSSTDDVLVWYEFVSDAQFGKMIFDSKRMVVVHPKKNKYEVIGKYNLVIKKFGSEDEGEYGCKLMRDNTFYVTSARIQTSNKENNKV